MEFGVLLAFVGVVTVISLAPGPDTFYVMANGMASGARAGVVAAIGMSTGLSLHTLAAVFGLSALLQAAPTAMDVVRVFGIVFLLYLAFQAFRSPGSAMDGVRADVPGRSLRRVYTMAVLTNLANPKIILFYLAFVPQFTSPEFSWPVPMQLLTLGGVFILVGVVVDGLTGLASGKLSEFLSRRRSVRKWLDRVSAGVFGALAVHLATKVARP
ncbi:threonine/homoserine/homoserine lactone efflux protein [Halopolyspora algeriensis]|uniref:Threonine/homoserine/homoserine lactone efflux protein n=1 Tax=Halopolyspora algeriensis TaxID=1500506 RepID=A0A368W2V1_9ACTN|nr:LysE family translocator [Halopolyspora algeriensis]RCW47013.1 threonine/homoserine/homoserine lactone efflux protein [Halopolyspora algeriensis]TQM48101.1 threonine/homoserine/homoserine lactone efflux protein [Halopolyspora algeriensis]